MDDASVIALIRSRETEQIERKQQLKDVEVPCGPLPARG